MLSLTDALDIGTFQTALSDKMKTFCSDNTISRLFDTVHLQSIYEKREQRSRFIKLDILGPVFCFLFIGAVKENIKKTKNVD